MSENKLTQEAEDFCKRHGIKSANQKKPEELHLMPVEAWPFAAAWTATHGNDHIPSAKDDIPGFLGTCEGFDIYFDQDAGVPKAVADQINEFLKDNPAAQERAMTPRMEFLKRIPEADQPTVYAMMAVCDSVELALLAKDAPRQGGPDPMSWLSKSMLTEVRKVVPCAGDS